MARDVAAAAKAVARPALMDVVKVAVKAVAKDEIAEVGEVDVAGNAVANVSVLMPKENPWPLATTPKAQVWMPTAPRVRVPRAVDAADATAIAVNAAIVPNALKMANARLIEMASRLHKPMPTASTTDRVKAARAAKVAVVAVAGAVAMTVAHVWTKPGTRFLRPKAKMTPMHRRPSKAAPAKAWTTATAMAAVHVTAMAASVARVVDVMLAHRTRKSKPQATSKCASPSAQARTATRRCVRISPKRRQRPARHQPRWQRMPMRPRTRQRKLAQPHRLAHSQRRLLSQ